MRRWRRWVAVTVGGLITLATLALAVRTFARWIEYREAVRAAPGVFIPIGTVDPQIVPEEAQSIDLGVISFHTARSINGVFIEQSLGTTGDSAKRVTITLDDARVWIMLPTRTDIAQTIDGEIIDPAVSLDYHERLAELSALRDPDALSLLFGSTRQFEEWKITMGGEAVMSSGGYATLETDHLRAVLAESAGAQAMVWSPDGRSACVVATMSLSRDPSPKDLLIEVLSTMRFETNPFPEQFGEGLRLLMESAQAHPAFVAGPATDPAAPTQSPSQQ